jgi:HK97 family phage prohead protease
MNKRIATPFNLKSITDTGLFSGYGAVFGNVDSYGDVVLPGAFKASLRKHQNKGTQPAMLLHHSSSRPCGVYHAVKEDDHGLFVEGQLLTSTTDGDEAYKLLKAGALNGLSIGYQLLDHEYNPKTGMDYLKEIDLWEVSLVVFPANEEARVTEVKTARDFEHFLCKNGFSRNRAKSICCQGFKDFNSQGTIFSHEIKRLLQSNIQLFKGH